MQVERHIAASPGHDQSPMLRYAALHRTIERGFATDATWAELASLCAELGKNDEALKAFGKIQDNGAPMRRTRSLLVRHKLLDPPSQEDRASEQAVSERDLQRNMFEEAFDCFRFLLSDHMPVTVIVATLAFPLVVGVGGMITGGSDLLFFSLLALIPSLCVFGLIGGLGRRILLEACDGLHDPPPIPDPQTLARDGLQFLRGTSVIGLTCFGPLILVGLLPGDLVPGLWVVEALLFLVGLALMPMAVALHQLNEDWKLLRPDPFLQALRAGGWAYAQLIGVLTALFAPAFGAAVLFSSGALWLTVSIVGPLLVAPLFCSLRLLGRALDMQRNELAPIIALPEKATARLGRSGTQMGRLTSRYVAVAVERDQQRRLAHKAREAAVRSTSKSVSAVAESARERIAASKKSAAAARQKKAQAAQAAAARRPAQQPTPQQQAPQQQRAPRQQQAQARKAQPQQQPQQQQQRSATGQRRTVQQQQPKQRASGPQGRVARAKAEQPAARKRVPALAGSASQPTAAARATSSPKDIAAAQAQARAARGKHPLAGDGRFAAPAAADHPVVSRTGGAQRPRPRR